MVWNIEDEGLFLGGILSKLLNSKLAISTMEHSDSLDFQCYKQCCNEQTYIHIHVHIFKSSSKPEEMLEVEFPNHRTCIFLNAC